jgi:hypothetical protein
MFSKDVKDKTLTTFERLFSIKAVFDSIWDQKRLLY